MTCSIRGSESHFRAKCPQRSSSSGGGYLVVEPPAVEAPQPRAPLGEGVLDLAPSRKDPCLGE